MLVDEALMSVGAIMIVISWLPQLIKLLRTKSSKDLSMPFLIVIITGTLFMVPHSIVINDIYFTSLNIVASIVATTVLIFSIKYRKGR